MGQSMPSSDRTAAPYSVADFAPLIAILGLLLASAVLVGISGDFPIGDDWAYAGSVRSLVWGGSWRPVDWSAPNMLTQSLWAVPFCALSKCSFQSLRLSTLAAAVLFVIFSYLLFRLTRTGAVVLTVALALVAFNPVGYELFYSFMTDTFFAMAFTVSMYFLTRSLDQDSAYFLVLGTAAAIIAILCRQVGACLPVGYALVRLFQNESWTRRLVFALTPLVICLLVVLAFPEWMRQTGRMPSNYNNVFGFIKDSAAHGTLVLVLFRNIAALLTYFGLFSAPLLLLTNPKDKGAVGPRRWGPIIVSVVLLAISVSRMIYLRSLMPISENMLNREGIGGLNLRDTLILHHQDVPPLPQAFWAAVTAIALFGQFVLVRRAAGYLISVWDRRGDFAIARNDSGPLLALVTVAVYCAPIVLITMYERYLTPLLPLIFYWIIATGKPNIGGVLAPALAGATLIATIGFAVLATHDYLAWNRARWDAATQLEQSHQADYTTLDGGFEYNGFRGFDPNYTSPPGKSRWWVRDDQYIISFGLLDGYSPVARYPYSIFLPPETRTLFVLRRRGPGTDGASR